MNTKTLVTVSTFVLFSLEAYSHFLIGKNSNLPKEKKGLFFPTFGESVKIFGIVAIFSFLNGAVVEYLNKN
jgi:hypothetical protein